MVESIQSFIITEPFFPFYKSNSEIICQILLNARKDLNEAFEKARKRQDKLAELRQVDKLYFELVQAIFRKVRID